VVPGTRAGRAAASEEPAEDGQAATG
jgi:hypothetical protein